MIPVERWDALVQERNQLRDDIKRLCAENKELRRELEYRKHGIDPAHANPDGSDYHIMNVIDEKLEQK